MAKLLERSPMPQDDPIFREGPTLYMKRSRRPSTGSTPSSQDRPSEPTAPASRPKNRPPNSRPQGREE